MRDRISARALLLTAVPGPGADAQEHVALLIELPDGSVAAGSPYWGNPPGCIAVEPGTWVPVTLPPGNPDKAKLDLDHVPAIRDVGAVIAEALGGPIASTPPPDEWRTALALAHVERLIARGVFAPHQEEAIRQRIRRGV